MNYNIETKCIHGDNETNKDVFGSVSVPIYQTATFAHPGIGESTGHNYTRESNPTRDTLENIVSSLEGAIDTVACSSGMEGLQLIGRGLVDFAAGIHDGLLCGAGVLVDQLVVVLDRKSVV